MIIVTTVRKVNEELEAKAKAVAQQLGARYVRRGGAGMDKLKRQHGCDTAVVIKKDQILLDLAHGEMFFHPNMAQVRIKRLRCGGTDNMLDAMNLERGMSVLDCTLGFGADAIVAAYGVGESGRVVGLEHSPLIALVTADGLKHYLPSNYDVKSAMDKIEVVNQDYMEYLKKLPSDSFDVVYFDPMFRYPLTDSANINPLREIADGDPVSLEAVAEAKRVARHRVVLKENSRSLEFARLGFEKICGGRYAPIHYGVIEVR